MTLILPPLKYYERGLDWIELILKMVFKFLRCHTYFFFEQPGKVRRVFKAKLEGDFGNALLASNKQVFRFID